MMVNPNSPGDVFVIAAGQEVRAVNVALDAVPDIDGQANRGFFYADVLTHPLRPLRVARGHIEPNGFVTRHPTRNHYLVTIVNGSGTIRVHDDGRQRQIAFKPADVIVFAPQTLHEWLNGPKPLDFVGVELVEN
jgi:quercetin dioxygenase-like cupin family protein